MEKDNQIIFKIVKRLSTIKPREEYTTLSRSRLLAQGVAPGMSFALFAKYIFRTGANMAVVAVALLIVFGGFSLARQFTPLGFSSLDPVGLEAEAEAIDIQVKLTDLNYKEEIQQKTNESTQAITEAPKSISFREEKKQTTTSSEVNIPQEPSIDDVLEILSK